MRDETFENREKLEKKADESLRTSLNQNEYKIVTSKNGLRYRILAFPLSAIQSKKPKKTSYRILAFPESSLK